MTPTRRIPVAKPCLGEEERTNLLAAFDSGWISSRGSFLERFEDRFAEENGAGHAIAVFNGTVALHVALAAAGIGPGDEVIVPALTYVASANAVTYVGATPVFADVDRSTWNPSAEGLAAVIGARTKAIMVAHIYGNPADMDAISELCSQHELLLVEDAAEAFGSEFGGRRTGSIGDVGTFSFFGNKTITTGEGGMVTTDDADLADRVRGLRNQGQSAERRYWHDRIGYNYRMTNLQAAIGLAQLERAPEILARKRAVVAHYRRALDGLPVRFQEDQPGAAPVHWMTSVLLDGAEAAERDRVISALDEAGIETRPLFPPLPSMAPYGGRTGAFPVTEALAAAGLSLPSGPQITDEELDTVGERLASILETPR